MRLVRAVIAAGCVCAAWLAAMVIAAAAPQASAAVTGGRLTTRVAPDPSAPGTRTTFEVDCGRGTFSATLFGVTLGMANLILMHSTPGGMPGEFSVTVTLPTSIRSGTYHPSVDCSDGAAGSFEFSVNPVPLRPAETGDGTTATQTGTPLVPVGYSLIGLGALAGALALRRSTARQ
jgi:hypothetical protein